MRNATKILILAAATVAMAGCHKQQQQQSANESQDMSPEGNLTESGIPANADIETLPPDESSEISSNELARGDDNPDVNDLDAAASNSH